MIYKLCVNVYFLFSVYNCLDVIEFVRTRTDGSFVNSYMNVVKCLHTKLKLIRKRKGKRHIIDGKNTEKC